MASEKWPPHPQRTITKTLTVEYPNGYVGKKTVNRPHREDLIWGQFKSRDEYEAFILGEAERIRSDHDAPSSSIEAAD
ncbi:MAG: hypothetical protein OXI41_00240 [Chloroflexota bacterium]|nr:hypothetical protein [Chloroflexota bacterium]MDE2893911.1 hypothetical protein [Chloroflexota bacterium]